MAALLGLRPPPAPDRAAAWVGVPDYDTYVAHRLAHHPGAEPVMSYAEFFRAAQQRRYAGSRMRGCC